MHKPEQKMVILLRAVMLVVVICCPVTAIQWSWKLENVDIGHTVFLDDTSIALDSSGYPHISYYDYVNKNLKFAWKDSTGMWSRDTLDSAGDVGSSSSLKVSQVDNMAGISYHDETNNQLKYAMQHPDGSWGIFDLDNGGHFTSLALDGVGRPHISYPASNGDTKYASWDGTVWHYQIVDSTGSIDGSSLALDSSGDPVIAYSKYSNDRNSLMYATIQCTPPHPPVPPLCLFVPTTVDSDSLVGGQDISMTFDGSGHPHISYWDMDSSEIKYATKDTGVWHIIPVDTIPGGPAGTSLAIDRSGNPAISYEDDAQDLVFAWKDAGSWHTMKVDHTGWVGAFSSLAFDGSGNAHISYIDQSNKILKYAKGTPVRPLPGYTMSPTDPDHDGIYEDLNANGRLDFADVVLYFNQMTWIAANEPIAAFDLNGNGRIDFADIVALFNEI